jgi:ketosteroid isomerase-like protein
VSQENVELVLSIVPAPDVDMAKLVRDDEMAEAWIEQLAPISHADFEWVAHAGPEVVQTVSGLDGVRAGLAEWFGPWTSYRSEVQQVIDCGDRVLVLLRDYGRLPETEQEVAYHPGLVYTVRDGKIAGLETFSDHADALKAVGLEP